MRDKALKSVSETFEDVLNILMLNSIKIIKWLFLIYGYEDYMILNITSVYIEMNISKIYERIKSLDI